MIWISRPHRRNAVQYAFYLVKRSRYTPICPAICESILTQTGYHISFEDVLINFPTLHRYKVQEGKNPIWSLSETGQNIRLSVLSEMYANDC
jgi:hypothetical protein